MSWVINLTFVNSISVAIGVCWCNTWLMNVADTWIFPCYVQRSSWRAVGRMYVDSGGTRAGLKRGRPAHPSIPLYYNHYYSLLSKTIVLAAMGWGGGPTLAIRILLPSKFNLLLNILPGSKYCQVASTCYL